MATRRQQIMQRYAELKEIHAKNAAELQAAESEMTELENELKDTPADVLDLDDIARKNEALRRAGLLL